MSTTEIEKHLKVKGIEMTQRTIQRDLNLLETLFRLECRRNISISKDLKQIVHPTFSK